MTRRRLACIVAAGTVSLLAVLAAGCGGGGGGEEAEQSAPSATGAEGETGGEAAGGAVQGEGQAGGTFRVEWFPSFDFTGGFDPSGEYLGEAWGLFSSLLVRTLVGYRHVAGAEGNELIPDLATDLGQVSDDGLSYTFTLKDGIKFGPPLSRPITSEDVKFAFERIGTKSVAAQYYFYYTPIEGFQDFYDGKADDISGITTPDDKTIVFKLAEPTGDFPYRLAMPAAGPMPEEVAGCFTEANVYGRYIVASGPYMIEGSDQQDASSCDTLQPLSGFDPNTQLILVRNPDYDPATDTPEARENLPDRYEMRTNSNTDDVFNRIREGETDLGVGAEPAKVLRDYTVNEDLAPHLSNLPGDRTWYVFMNITQPPLDDIHVRKAINLVMDKDGLRRAWGGPIAGDIATHIVPNAMLNDALADYDPYPSPEGAGDVAAAMEEMKQSRYDTDQDGLCDAPECKDVFYVTSTDTVRQDLIPPTQASLEKIGITLKVRSLEDPYQLLNDVSKNVAMSGRVGWGKDYADASTFFVLLDSAAIIPDGNTNYSLVGLTQQQASEIPGLQGDLENVPSIDDGIDACNKLPVGDERQQCWGDLDKQTMEDVVPWVPYLDATAPFVTSENVTQIAYDQFCACPGYAHMAVAQ